KSVPANATSAMSPRTAFTRPSRWTERPARTKRSGAHAFPGDGSGGSTIVDEGIEAFKKIFAFPRGRDENIAAIRFVTLAGQIAERAEPVQGASDDRLRNIQAVRETTDGVRPRFQIDHKQKSHLTIGKIGFPGSNIFKKGRHPSLQAIVRHSVHPFNSLRRACRMRY